MGCLTFGNWFKVNQELGEALVYNKFPRISISSKMQMIFGCVYVVSMAMMEKWIMQLQWQMVGFLIRTLTGPFQLLWKVWICVVRQTLFLASLGV